MCVAALTGRVFSDILWVMAISQSAKDDVFYTVSIEMERMFGILDSYYPPELDDQVLLLRKIEAAFKNTMKTMDRSTSRPSTSTRDHWPFIFDQP